MAKDFNDITGLVFPTKPISAVKKKSDYDKKIAKLEKILPDDELRELGRNFGTTRKEVDWDNICRVVPAEWVEFPMLLHMPKDNKISPETEIPRIYAELKVKVQKLQRNRRD